jgi:hypothetical protein
VHATITTPLSVFPSTGKILYFAKPRQKALPFLPIYKEFTENIVQK